MADFAQTITTAYATDGAALDLGRGVHDGAVVTGATVKLPLRMVNRHGLIAGATGTRKNKKLQGIGGHMLSARGAAGAGPTARGTCRGWQSQATRAARPPSAPRSSACSSRRAGSRWSSSPS